MSGLKRHYVKMLYERYALPKTHLQKLSEEGLSQIGRYIEESHYSPTGALRAVEASAGLICRECGKQPSRCACSERG